jgi:NAD(P)-dependent dehydrogenase (short-subunit alcohol dehydrogenase family)
MDIDEKRSVVVTGGSAGVGRAVAIRFARAGAQVSLIGRSREGLESAKRDIEAGGGVAAIYPVDVSDCRSVFLAADDIAMRCDGIDIWINNATASMFAPASEMTSEEFGRITAVAYLGYVHGAMAALKHMRPKNRGVIVQVGSALSYRAIPLQSAYCGAKFAIRAFTDSLRSELRHEKSGVRLTMIQLPAVNTPQFNWARNRLPYRPRPIAPVFRPEDIGDIIFRAAQKAPREVWVGVPTLKIILGAAVAPVLLDRYLARAGYDGQMSDETETGARADNLFEPVHAHATRGRFCAEAKGRPIAFNPEWLRALFGALLAILVVCGAIAALIVLR